MTSDPDRQGANQLVLVTGAGGFIGSHLVDYLLEQGHRVRALVRYSSHGGVGHLGDLTAQLRQEHGTEPAPELGASAARSGPLEVVWGDITDASLVRRICGGVDAVCHLAALIGIPYSYVAPVSYVEVNIGGTLNVLEAARALGVARVIHTSTSEVYGTARYTPIDLAHPLQGQSPYSATKIGADKLVESYARSFEMDAVVLRPFNTFGPRQSFRAVIPTVIGQALAGGAITLGNLTAVRDFTYVRDTCRAFGLALRAQLPRPATVHLGTGVGVTIAELCERIGKLTGAPLETQTDPARIRPAKSEVEVLLSDPTCAWEALGWKPEVSLDEGLARTIEWMRAHTMQGGDRYHV